MDPRDPAVPVQAEVIADEAIATVRRWLAASAGEAPVEQDRLSGLLRQPEGSQFVLGFLDGVLRPEDLRVAGRNLERLSRRPPSAMRWYTRLALLLAGGFAPLLPWLVVPWARATFGKFVSHLMVESDADALGPHLEAIRQKGGIRPMLAPLGREATGDRLADAQLAEAHVLAGRGDVDALAITLSSVVSRLTPWGFAQAVERAFERLEPLYQRAADSPDAALIVLEVERFRDLELTVATFQRLLERFPSLEAAITLPAYLPESLPALKYLTTWAIDRRARGGARIQVRLVKGDHLGEERVEAATTGLPLAPFAHRSDTDAQFARVIDFALTPERCAAVAVTVATHNLFDVAFAWRLARSRGVARSVEYEFMLGLASAQVEAVKRDVGGIRLYTPVAHDGDRAVTVPYLFRRIRGLIDRDAFLSTASELTARERLFGRAADRFLAALADARNPSPGTHRRQEKVREVNADPGSPPPREWAAAVLASSWESEYGAQLLRESERVDGDGVRAAIDETARAAQEWAQRRGVTRAAVLVSIAEAFVEWRSVLVEVAVSEAGLTIAQADSAVTDAIHLARHYADLAGLIDSIADARFAPDPVIVVHPPAWGPIVEPAQAVMSTLAAGSGVAVFTSGSRGRSAAVLVEVLRAGGVPPQLVTLVSCDDELVRGVLSDARVRTIAPVGLNTSGASGAAGPARGNNAIIVTAAADPDQAVPDLVASAFLGAGQPDSAAGLVIAVGTVAESEAFRSRLVDAVSSLRVGSPRDAATELGPLAVPASAEELRALAVLDDGESWLVTPRQLDATGRLWSPGLRDGVRAGSHFHVTANRAPVLGIMTAATLAEAIDLQNAAGRGAAAGLYSLDAGEQAEWLLASQATSLFVNLPIRFDRPVLRPHAGWDRSHAGDGWMVGGKNELFALGDWLPVDTEPGRSVRMTGVHASVASLVEAAQPSMDYLQFDWVRAAARSDELAWAGEFTMARENRGGAFESVEFRYRPIPVTVRLAEGAALAGLVRVLAAAAITGAPVSISSAVPLPAGLIDLFRGPSPVSVMDVVIETDLRWNARAQAGHIDTPRIRLIGAEAPALADLMPGGVAIFGGPVTASGRVELLPFLQERTTSVATHRFGFPDSPLAELPL